MANGRPRLNMEKQLCDVPAWLWRYLENERNYPGLHFTARPEGCAAVRGAVQRIVQDGGGRRTIGLRELAPSDEAKISGGHGYVWFAKLRLEVKAPTEQLRFMHLSFEHDTAFLAITEGYLPRLLEGIADIERGTGDWALGPPADRNAKSRLGQHDRESLELWFWPCFGHLWPVT